MGDAHDYTADPLPSLDVPEASITWASGYVVLIGAERGLISGL